jgi:NADH:ubiquinone oxidoreductase subunit 5 (subunit L)/multisubunit Na+/H+ antiporter MnhA subunit
MAAGLVYAALGHDRIDDLAGAARALPIAVLAFVLGGVALMGVLPSGAYLAKKLLLDSADASGQWVWTLVLQGGAVFTAGYVVLVLARVLRRPAQPLTGLQPVSTLSQLAALGLSVASLGLALAAVVGPLPASLVSNPLSPKELGNTLVVLAVGTLLAWSLARRPLFAVESGALRGATQALALGFERGDHFVRRWPSAMVALLGIAAMFGWLLARA